MKQLKKTILTLVALLAVTTGAWADGPVDGTIAWSVGNETSATVSASIMDAISSTGVTTGSGLNVSVSKYFNTNMVQYKPATANAGNVEGVMIEYTIEAVDGYKFKPTGVDYAAVQDGTSEASYSWSYTIDGVESAITDVSNTSVLRNNGSNSGTAQLMHSESITADGCSVFTLRFYISNCGTTKKIGIGNITISGSVSVAAAASSGPEVTWDEAKNTGSFTMPGGNVTLEPDYYPQATVADGAVTAADDDARATTDDPLVKVDATKLTGAKKLMYFVSNSGTTAPAYDAEGWTDQLPTAEGLTQQGIVYVYYYPVGTDEGVDGATATYSDGDICLQSITARIADAPTYAVTFADDTAEPDKWKAEPNTGVTKGQTVTVTYTGTKKVIGVKAEKKAAVTYPLLSAATTSDHGKVVCAAGHLHDAKTAVPDGCTAVGILGKVTETGHGLILSLEKTYFQDWYTINGWTSASYAGTTLKVLPDDARGTDLTSYTALGETTVSNWAVGQKSDYEAIFENLGSTTGNSDGKTYDANVNAYITSVGGTAIAGEYWSATDDDDDPWYFDSSSWSNRDKGQSNSVWPVLGF